MDFLFYYLDDSYFVTKSEDDYYCLYYDPCQKDELKEQTTNSCQQVPVWCESEDSFCLMGQCFPFPWPYANQMYSWRQNTFWNKY